MTTYIDQPQYTTLAGYAVLGGSGVTFPDIPGITLSGGVYGSNPTPTVTGFVNGASVGTGNNVGGDVDARAQCTALYNFLNGLPATAVTIGAGPNYSFEPGVYKVTDAIDFASGNTITFTNTGGTPNAQWVIISASKIAFTDVPTITYGPATAKSIYWVAGSSITVDGSTTATMRGVFMGGTTVTFTGTAIPNSGAAYAGSEGVTFEQAGTMVGLGFPAICFPGNTPINTDQGILPINRLVAGVHTINNKRIVAITETGDENTFLVCFKKDSLGKNIPDRDTIMSKYHGVEYNGEMIEAHQFLEQFENIVKVEYKGEMLYNILMDNHEKIIVNNLTCETLNPEHPYAKKYNTPAITKINVDISCA